MNNETYVGTRETYTDVPVGVNEKEDLINSKVEYLEKICKYTVEEVSTDELWGGRIRLASGDAEEFVAEFFDQLSYNELRHKSKEAELVPEIIIISPDQRINLQAHEQSCRYIGFLSEGVYSKSDSDVIPELPYYAREGVQLQLNPGVRYQLGPLPNRYAYIAQI